MVREVVAEMLVANHEIHWRPGTNKSQFHNPETGRWIGRKTKTGRAIFDKYYKKFNAAQWKAATHAANARAARAIKEKAKQRKCQLFEIPPIKKHHFFNSMDKKRGIFTKREGRSIFFGRETNLWYNISFCENSNH